MEERDMNAKKFIITSIVVFVVYEILSWLIHGLILMGAYEATASVWRTMEDMNSKMWIMWIGNLIWSFLFVYIFTKGYESKGPMEGVRYGLLIGLFMAIPMSIGSYVSIPMPFSLAVYWFLLSIVQITICGIVAGLIYKPAAKK